MIGESILNNQHFHQSFNLSKDYLDIYGTVIEMRQQRMKMVQKEAQYLYVFKCLKDEIDNVEGNHYEL